MDFCSSKLWPHLFDRGGGEHKGVVLMLPAPATGKCLSIFFCRVLAAGSFRSRDFATVQGSRSGLRSQHQVRSGKMHFLLILSLLASSISLGFSLRCETCHAFGNTCTGSWENCPPEKDSCSIIQMEGSGLTQHKAIGKSCIRSRYCTLPDYSVSLGRAGQTFTRITCCRGKECQKIPPALPPINTTLNGKRCPACYVSHSHECTEEIAECAGNENYCFGTVGTKELGGMSVDAVMKGCTNSVSCNETLDESFGTIKMVSKSSCVPANEGASSVPASFGFLFRAFTGLLLLKVLS